MGIPVSLIEELLPIPGYAGYYTTPCGEVVSTNSGRPILLSRRLSNSGYETVTVTRDDGRRCSEGVHRLIALAYVDNPDPATKVEVNHIDGGKLNNWPDNLEWCTRSENEQCKVASGTSKLCRKISIVKPDGTRIIAPSLRRAAAAFGVDGKTLHEQLNKSTQPTTYRGCVISYCNGSTVTDMKEVVI